MTKPPAPPVAPVRYRVLKPTFVNGDLIKPGERRDVFVMAAPGLKGSALELAPEGADQPKAQSAPVGTGQPKAQG